MTIAIQGDIRIIKINKLPENAVKKSNTVLVEGEVTGHAHRLTNGEVYELDERILFTVPARSMIIHEEHDLISLEKGTYEIVRQREYTGRDMTRLVVD